MRPRRCLWISLRAEGCDAEYFLCDVSDRTRVDEVAGEILRPLSPHRRAGEQRRHIADQAVHRSATPEEVLAARVRRQRGRRVQLHAGRAGRHDQRKERRDRQHILDVGASVGASCESHYAASKAALIGLSKSLALELGPSGIRVNCVAPRRHRHRHERDAPGRGRHAVAGGRNAARAHRTRGRGRGQHPVSLLGKGVFHSEVLLNRRHDHLTRGALLFLAALLKPFQSLCTPMRSASITRKGLPRRSGSLRTLVCFYHFRPQSVFI